MKRLLLTTKLLSFMLFIFIVLFILFNSMFLNNTEILKFTDITISFIFLIFLLFTFHIKDFFLLKTLINSIENFVNYYNKKNLFKYIIIFLIYVISNLAPLINIYLTLNLLLINQQKFEDNLYIEIIKIIILIILFLISIVFLLVKLKIILNLKKIKPQYKLNLKNYKGYFYNFYTKTCKINIVIYILFILELILCLYIIN